MKERLESLIAPVDNSPLPSPLPPPPQEESPEHELIRLRHERDLLERLLETEVRLRARLWHRYLALRESLGEADTLARRSGPDLVSHDE